MGLRVNFHDDGFDAGIALYEDAFCCTGHGKLEDERRKDGLLKVANGRLGLENDGEFMELWV